MNNTTLKKIAETLGCSISTVSRALKHHPDISVKTREKILELANTLDYEPNAFAVHLRTRNSKVIGLMVPTLSNYFYETFIASVEEESRKNGYALMILQSANDPAIEMENLKLFRQNRVTGLFACITANTHSLESFTKMSEQNVPVIYFDNVPDELGLNKVCLADERAAELAAEAIIQSKKKQVVALFGDAGLTITQKRMGKLSAMLQNKSDAIHLTIIHAGNSEEAEKAISANLAKKNKTDLIFCMSDELLIGAMKAIQINQLRIPDQVSVIGISNGFVPKLYYPEITYVETSGYKLGKLAFTHLMACLAGSTAIKELTLESVLVKGGSI